MSKPPVDQLAPSNQSHHSQEFNLAPRMDAATMDGTGGRGAANSAQGKERLTNKETTLDSVRGFIDKETYRNSSLASFSRTQPLLYTHQLYRRVHRKINLLGYIKRTWTAPGPTPRRLPSSPHSAIHSSDHGQPRLHPSLLTHPRTVHHQQGD